MNVLRYFGTQTYIMLGTMFCSTHTSKIVLLSRENGRVLSLTCSPDETSEVSVLETRIVTEETGVGYHRRDILGRIFILARLLQHMIIAKIHINIYSE